MTASVHAIINSFPQISSTKGPTSLQVEQLVNQLLGEYHAQCLYPPVESPPGAAQLLDFIMQDLQQPVADILPALRNHFFMTNKALNYQWKKYNPLSLRAYINRLRMEYALYLLKVEGRKEKEVDELLNYNNPSSFIRQFKLHFGYTPANAGSLIAQ